MIEITFTKGTKRLKQENNNGDNSGFFKEKKKNLPNLCAVLQVSNLNFGLDLAC